MPAIIETEDLTRRFGRTLAVDRLGLAVEEGEVFGLLGQNGAGKTTTIKMLTTLLRPSAGRASVAGHDVVRDAAGVRRVIGYVPQMISVDGALTGRENLTFLAALYDVPARERAARVDGALAFMGLGDAADRFVRTYSGGMIRRLEIAQAVIHRPSVLFLDEPTVGLDPMARAAVWDHVEMLRAEQRTTILISTHQMDEAEAHCGRVAIMHGGRLAALGPPRALEAGVGPGATLAEVFARFSDHGQDDPAVGPGPRGGSLHDAALNRSAIRRLG